MSQITAACVLILVNGCLITGKLRSDTRVLNVCMDGMHHMSEPEKGELYGLCNSWRSSACCTNTTSHLLQQPFSKLYNLDLDHCGKMSEKCKKRFALSNCFYECSPNVGPWLVKVKSSYRNERYLQVPLCAKECNAWWNDCKDDLTCVENWSTGFEWNITNYCPADKPCKNFSDIYQNATNFCQTIFINDYIVTDDSKPCMRFDFPGPKNPNAKVAMEYAKLKKLIVHESDRKHMLMAEDEAAAGSPNSTVKPYFPPTKVPVLQQTGTSITIILTVLFLTVVAGFLIFKCKLVQIQKCFECPAWFKATSPARSARHHIVSTDRRVLLPDDYESDDGYSLNPHGTLEIHL